MLRRPTLTATRAPAGARGSTLSCNCLFRQRQQFTPAVRSPSSLSQQPTSGDCFGSSGIPNFRSNSRSLTVRPIAALRTTLSPATEECLLAAKRFAAEQDGGSGEMIGAYHLFLGLMSAGSEAEACHCGRELRALLKNSGISFENAKRALLPKHSSLKGAQLGTSGERPGDAASAGSDDERLRSVSGLVFLKEARLVAFHEGCDTIAPDHILQVLLMLPLEYPNPGNLPLNPLAKMWQEMGGVPSASLLTKICHQFLRAVPAAGYQPFSQTKGSPPAADAPGDGQQMSGQAQRFHAQVPSDISDELEALLALTVPVINSMSAPDLTRVLNILSKQRHMGPGLDVLDAVQQRLTALQLDVLVDWSVHGLPMLAAARDASICIPLNRFFVEAYAYYCKTSPDRLFQPHQLGSAVPLLLWHLHGSYKQPADSRDIASQQVDASSHGFSPRFHSTVWSESLDADCTGADMPAYLMAVDALGLVPGRLLCLAAIGWLLGGNSDVEVIALMAKFSSSFDEHGRLQDLRRLVLKEADRCLNAKECSARTAVRLLGAIAASCSSSPAGSPSSPDQSLNDLVNGILQYIIVRGCYSFGPSEILLAVQALQQLGTSAEPEVELLQGLAAIMTASAPIMSQDQILSLLRTIQSYHRREVFLGGMTQGDAFLNIMLGPSSKFSKRQRSEAASLVLDLGWPLSNTWILKCASACKKICHTSHVINVLHLLDAARCAVPVQQHTDDGGSSQPPPADAPFDATSSPKSRHSQHAAGDGSSSQLTPADHPLESMPAHSQLMACDGGGSAAFCHAFITEYHARQDSMPADLSTMLSGVLSSIASQDRPDAASGPSSEVVDLPSGQGFTPRQAMMTVWGAAVLRLQPPQGWLAAMWERVQPALVEPAGVQHDGVPRGRLLGDDERMLASWAFGALQQANLREYLVRTVTTLSTPGSSVQSLAAAVWVLAQDPSFSLPAPGARQAPDQQSKPCEGAVPPCSREWLDQTYDTLSSALVGKDLPSRGEDPGSDSACRAAASAGLLCLAQMGYQR